eukprot:m51a1_g575 hypothetical protein (696) ;mRNA; r:541126-543290
MQQQQQGAQAWGRRCLRPAYVFMAALVACNVVVVLRLTSSGAAHGLPSPSPSSPSAAIAPSSPPSQPAHPHGHLAAALAGRDPLQRLGQLEELLAEGDARRCGRAVALSRYDTLRLVLEHCLRQRCRRVVTVWGPRTQRSAEAAAAAAAAGAAAHGSDPRGWDWGEGLVPEVLGACAAGSDWGMSVEAAESNASRLAAGRAIASALRVGPPALARVELPLGDRSSVAFVGALGPRSVDVLVLGGAPRLYHTPHPNWTRPLEDGGELRLAEAVAAVERDVVAPGGLLVLDGGGCDRGDWELGMHRYPLRFLQRSGYVLEVLGATQAVLRRDGEDAVRWLPVPASEEKAVPSRPLRVLHLSFHRGCQLDLEWVFRQLGLVLDFAAIEDPVDMGENWLKYNMNRERADRIWQANRTFFEKYDLIVTSDTAAIARIFIQHNWPRKLIVWVCNRFDWAHGSRKGKEEIANGHPYPDQEYYDMFRLLGAYQRLGVRSPWAVAGYTAYENIYARQHRRVELGNLIITPTGKGYDGAPAPAVSKIPESVVRGETLFIPPYQNDRPIPRKCEELGLKCYRGRYAGTADIRGFRAILHMPYAWSNLALFEFLNEGHVYLIPTPELLYTLDPFWSFPFDKPNLYTSEWYDPAHRHLFIIFDSWEDLVVKANNDTLIKETRERVVEFMSRHPWEMLERWRRLIASLA